MPGLHMYVVERPMLSCHREKSKSWRASCGRSSLIFQKSCNSKRVSQFWSFIISWFWRFIHVDACTHCRELMKSVGSQSWHNGCLQWIFLCNLIDFPSFSRVFFPVYRIGEIQYHRIVQSCLQGLISTINRLSRLLVMPLNEPCCKFGCKDSYIFLFQIGITLILGFLCREASKSDSGCCTTFLASSTILVGGRSLEKTSGNLGFEQTADGNFHTSFIAWLSWSS